LPVAYLALTIVSASLIQLATNSKRNVVATRRFLATPMEDMFNLRIRSRKERHETQPGWEEFCPIRVFRESFYSIAPIPKKQPFLYFSIFPRSTAFLLRKLRGKRGRRPF
jgi:hypothetical protein